MPALFLPTVSSPDKSSQNKAITDNEIQSEDHQSSLVFVAVGKLGELEALIH